MSNSNFHLRRTVRFGAGVLILGLARLLLAPTAAQPAATALPADWIQQDIGSPAPAGSARVAEGTFSIAGGGRGVGGVDFHHESIGRGDLSYDVRGYADELQFCGRPWNGDGEIVARLTSLSGGSNAHAGLTVRSGADASAINAFFAVRADGTLRVSARAATAIDTRRRNETTASDAATGAQALPVWLKLVRRGAGIMAYTSTDGANWREEVWLTARFEAGVHFGLAVSSGEPGVLATATFDQVAVGPVVTAIPAAPAPAVPKVFYVENETVTLDVPYQATAADRVELERATAGGAFVPVATLFQEGLYYDRNLAAGTSYTYRLRAGRGPVMSGYSPTLMVTTTGVASGQPAIAAQPVSRAASPGDTVTFNAGTTAQNAAYQWQLNGANLGGANASTLTVDRATPASAGIYTATIAAGGTTLTTQPAVLGVVSANKVVGAGTEVGTDILHPSGNIFDQILLQGVALSVTANPGQVTRVSFIDLSDDIVQVEFSGAGTLTLSLDGASGPAEPRLYNQTGVSYMKGQANLIVTGADETTHLSVFSVGLANAVNPALFRDGVKYDGVADIGYIAVLSANGRFGSLRTANASFSAIRGWTGVYAPGVEFSGPVYVGDIRAFDTANPVLMVGAVAEVRIAGGDLAQDNGRAVQVSGLTRLRFDAGGTSHGDVLPMQTNHARLEQNGADVTAQTVVNSN